MIISALLNLIYTVLSVLLVFQLPNLPDSVLQVAGSITQYVRSGVGVLASFIGSEALGVIALLLQLVLVLNAAYLLYSLVFWVLRKIPMLGVKE